MLWKRTSKKKRKIDEEYENIDKALQDTVIKIDMPS